jgi:hypothetical protein
MSDSFVYPTYKQQKESYSQRRSTAQIFGIQALTVPEKFNYITAGISTTGTSRSIAIRNREAYYDLGYSRTEEYSSGERDHDPDRDFSVTPGFSFCLREIESRKVSILYLLTMFINCSLYSLWSAARVYPHLCRKELEVNVLLRLLIRFSDIQDARWCKQEALYLVHKLVLG